MNHANLWLAATLAVTTLLHGDNANAAAFRAVPFLEPSEGLLQRQWIVAFSDDGSTAVVRQYWNRADEPFEFVHGVWGHWTVGDAAVTPFGTAAELPQYLIRDVSADGQQFVGIDQTSFRYPRAVRLHADGTTEVFAPPSPYDRSGASFISGDGETIIGYVGLLNEGWFGGYWDERNTFSLFDTPIERNTTAASADASVVVGHLPSTWPAADQRGLPYRWTSDGDVELLPVDSHDASYRVNGLSDDGRWTVGRVRGEDAAIEAVLWDGLSMPEKLEPAIDGWGTTAYDISADTSRVLGAVCRDGTCFDSGQAEAAIWTRETGFRPLSEILGDLGLAEQTAGWHLGRAEHLSSSGRYIAGRGLNPQGQQQAYWIDLGAAVPEPGGAALLLVAAMTLIAKSSDRSRSRHSSRG